MLQAELYTLSVTGYINYQTTENDLAGANTELRVNQHGHTSR